MAISRWKQTRSELRMNSRYAEPQITRSLEEASMTPDTLRALRRRVPDGDAPLSLAN